MAFYSSDEENENVQGMNSQKPEDQQQAQQQLSGGVSTSGSAPIATGTQAPTSSPKSTSSGQTGFQNYQKANQGAATNKLNTATSANVSNQSQAAKTGINQATTAFGQKVDAGSLANRENAVTDVKSAVEAARTVTAPPATQTAFGAPKTAQAGIAKPVTEQPTAPTQVPAVPQIDPAKTSRFQEVINAKYQGPESLRQSGEYNKASGQVKNSQTAIDQTKSAQGREELLKNIFSQGGQYTQGQNKLDAGLLNASQSGVSQLQNAAKAAGNIQGQLDQAQIASANLAQNRTNEISDIRNQSRTAFTEGKAAEEAATESRLSGVIKDWDKLPEYFKDIIRNRSNGSSIDLNSLESGILGVNAGEGFYNLGADAIKTGVADRERLISRDEQARQAALAQLGALDQQKMLSTALKYGDASKAGTQTALDALDLAGTRTGLNAAEQNFQDYAEGTDLTGYGSKKNKSSGKRYYAEESANLGNLLKNAGYNFDGASSTNNIGNPDLLKALANVSDRNDLSPAQSGVMGAVSGAANAYTNGFSNLGDGQSLTAGGVDLLGSALGLNAITGALGLGGLSDAVAKAGQKGSDAAGTYADFIGDTTGVNAGLNAVGLGKIGGAVTNVGNAITKALGFGGGSSSKESKSIAAQGAAQDLQNKVTSALESQGYGNRANVVNNNATTARVSALQQLLANLDKTNV